MDIGRVLYPQNQWQDEEAKKMANLWNFFRNRPPLVDLTATSPRVAQLLEKILTERSLPSTGVTIVELAELLNIATVLGITHLVKEFKKTLTSFWITDDALALPQALSLAKSLSFDDVVEQLLPKIANNFEHCYQPLLKYVKDFKLLAQVASRCDLEVSDEFQVACFVLDWIQANHSVVVDEFQLRTLWRSVRMTRLTEEQLALCSQIMPADQQRMLDNFGQPPAVCSHDHSAGPSKRCTGFSEIPRSFLDLNEDVPEIEFRPPASQGQATWSQKLNVFPNTRQKIKSVVGQGVQTLRRTIRIRHSPVGNGYITAVFGCPSYRHRNCYRNANHCNHPNDNDHNRHSDHDYDTCGDNCMATFTCTSPTGVCTAALVFQTEGGTGMNVNDEFPVATLMVTCTAGEWTYMPKGGGTTTGFAKISCKDKSQKCFDF
ncbi:unnamed protein product [Caenorhabditis auriculariae]|uniref:BACK domain-containing protein n=1 Tax=Caenorhabditis auriculariae TaxID=2777116 RepID=A0A8S1HSH6_9PELO|nr:unnamed protein product [Caenorhabditis auriculariae]